MKKKISGILICTLLATSTFTIALMSNVAEASVTNYEISCVAQTGINQITVSVKAQFCTACNPNYLSMPGDPAFPSYTWWIDGRYVAVRIKDANTGTMLGTTQKLVCNPTNWPLNDNNPRIFVFDDITLTGISTVIVESDIYCSWCGHWYPSPKTLQVAPLKICIDPGHSPTDSNSDKRIEYAINKGVADKLKSKLEIKGYIVDLTEPVDTPSRASWVNNVFKPDIFISLHCNAAQGFNEGEPIGTVKGSEIWFYDDTDSSKQAMNEHDLAVRILNAFTDEIDSNVRLPIPKEKENPWDGTMHTCYKIPWDAGYWLGIPLLNGDCTACGWRFGVTICPAVLIEMEFFDYSAEMIYKSVTYPNMLSLMNSEIWREDASQGMYNGIIGYIEEKGITTNGKCPIDITITDPDNLRINKQINEIPGATYTELDLDEDGDLDDHIRIPDRKIGSYSIEVMPEPSAQPTDTYNLEISLFGITYILAENVQISNIPSEPYIIESTESGIILPEIDNTPPSIIIYASPSLLWPPNNKMKNVLISGSATDAGSGIASVTFTVEDEYNLVEPSLTGFGQTIQLQAMRYGYDFDGRIYTITATATDNLGHVTTASTIVRVPHDQGN